MKVVSTELNDQKDEKAETNRDLNSCKRRALMDIHKTAGYYLCFGFRWGGRIEIDFHFLFIHFRWSGGDDDCVNGSFKLFKWPCIITCDKLLYLKEIIKKIVLTWFHKIILFYKQKITIHIKRQSIKLKAILL